MKLSVLPLVPLLMLFACSVLKLRELVQYNPRYYGEFTILQHSSSATNELYVFESPTGVFSFDIHPFDASLKNITFVLSNLGSLSGLCVSGSEGEWIELYAPPSNSVAGVTVENRRGSFIVTIIDPALNYLRPGVRFTVIDQYRE